VTEQASRTRQIRQWVLAGLLLALASVVGYQVMGGSATQALPSSNPTTRSGIAEAGGGAPPPEVRIEALAAGAAAEPVPGRNPFRFQPRAAARPAQGEGGSAGTPAAPRLEPVAPRPAPTAPPIALKFIGTMASADRGLIAALSDGTFVFHGREGDVVDGRYRIVQIGVESIVLERVDGSGRQTIRLTG